MTKVFAFIIKLNIHQKYYFTKETGGSFIFSKLE